MKRIACTLMACLMTTSAVAEEVRRNIDAAAKGHVEVSNVSGSVEVVGWSRNEIEVVGTLGHNVKELLIERDGNEVTIKVKVPRRGGRGINSELQIKVPAGSSLDIGTVSANIDVRKVRGEQSLHAVSGKVETEFSGADLSLESVSGSVDVKGDGSDGEIEANSVSGSVRMVNVSGSVEAETVTGRVRAEGERFERAELGSVNGRVTFKGALAKDGDLSIETVNGSVEVDFTKPVSARIEIDTFNGGIHNCFGPKAKRTNRYGPGWELEFEAGDGDGHVEISTLNGRVNICQE